MLITKNFLENEVDALNKVFSDNYRAEIRRNDGRSYIAITDETGKNIPGEYYTAKEVVDGCMKQVLSDELLDGEWNKSGKRFETFEEAKDYTLKENINPQFEKLFLLLTILEDYPDVKMVPGQDANYLLSADEIEAAYRYQQLAYRTEDADDAIENYIYGVSEAYLERDPNYKLYAENNFKRRYGMTVDEAFDYSEEIARRFIDEYDCNVDENSQFYSITADVFSKIAHENEKADILFKMVVASEKKTRKPKNNTD